MNKLLLYEYTKVLLGEQDWVTGDFFVQGDKINEANAIELFKYAFTIFNNCHNPESMKMLISDEFIKRMKLEKALGFIKFPVELVQNKDLTYIIHLMYPYKVPYNTKDLTIKIYENVINGINSKFPRSYFAEEIGSKRLNTCFIYMLTHYCNFNSTREMYHFFSTKAGERMIDKYRLKQAVSSYYDDCLELLHDALPDEQKSDFWFYFYRFYKMFQRATKSDNKKEEGILNSNET